MDKTLEGLLQRQNQINNQLIELANESLKVNRELEKFLKNENSNTKDIKEKLEELLRKKGYKVSQNTIQNTRVIQIEKGSIKKLINIRTSKYWAKKYNAWYTITDKSVVGLDFLVLEYLDNKGTNNCLVLPQKIIENLVRAIKHTADGRIHIQLRANGDFATEEKSKIDLTEYINKFELL
ncbi:hypothetical protein [Enterococcus nangangensis]|uniref:hypothetical protein n=1 Tax=Enterococcus nangangensis TaxID=2559926 RepID=UPI0010F50900|nr:hypothetical protein [Enterococcus nangangensis]